MYGSVCRRIASECTHCILASVQYAAFTQWVVQPMAEQAAAHAGRAFIEHGKQRRGGLAAKSFSQFQIASRGGIETHVFADVLRNDSGDVNQCLAYSSKAPAAAIPGRKSSQP